jgi:hypothetical protein
MLHILASCLACISLIILYRIKALTRSILPVNCSKLSQVWRIPCFHASHDIMDQVMSANMLLTYSCLRIWTVRRHIISAQLVCPQTHFRLDLRERRCMTFRSAQILSELFVNIDKSSLAVWLSKRSYWALRQIIGIMRLSSGSGVV